MYHVHVLGCASALFDNLCSWRNRLATFEQSPLDCLPSAIERIRSARPEWVVYCGQAAASSWDEPMRAHAINRSDEASLVAQLAQLVTEAGARLAVISSDRVFAGPRMFHDESEPVGDAPHADLLHSIEQAARAVDTATQRALIVRTNTFGWTLGGDSFAERIWRALEYGQSIELSATAFATPILASDLAELLLRCFRARLSGVVHIGGAERTNPIRFGQELAVAAGFDPQLVKARGVEPDDDNALLSQETSLGSRLVRRELDVSLPLLRESVARFADQATNGYRHQLQSIPERTLVRAA
ncbi:MAG: sugar nucleotide-binding protein [Pirellulales bacterium]